MVVRHVRGFAYLLEFPRVRTRGLFRDDLEQQLGNISLAALAGTYHLDFHEAHHALDDAFVTARLWQKMTGKLQAMKMSTLGDLLRIAKA